MPIYGYQCASCGHQKDVLQKMSDAPLTTCPACEAEAFSRQVSAPNFQLKGDGWYVTDFRDGNKGGDKNGKGGGSTGKDGGESGGSSDAGAGKTDGDSSASKTSEASSSAKSAADGGSAASSDKASGASASGAAS